MCCSKPPEAKNIEKDFAVLLSAAVIHNFYCKKNGNML